MIRISLQQAIREISKAEKEFGEQKVHAAVRQALNEGIRKGRTEVRRSIQSLYNIKASRINDSDKRKGLSLRLATNKNLEADLDAGHVPITLSDTSVSYKGDVVAVSFKRNKSGKITNKKNIKRSTGIITVEIIKGQSKTIPSAFTIGVSSGATGIQSATSAIFARGKRGKPDFQFGKDRLPIDVISTVSVATAVISVRSQSIYNQTVTDYTMQRLMRSLKRLGST